MFSNFCIKLHVVCVGIWLIYLHCFALHDVRHFLNRLPVFGKMYILRCVDLHACGCQWCWLLCWNSCIQECIELTMNIYNTICCPSLTFADRFLSNHTVSNTQQKIRLFLKVGYCHSISYVSICCMHACFFWNLLKLTYV